MKVKVSYPMKKYLQENIPEYKFYLLKMGVEQYKVSVDYDLFGNEADFNPAKSEMKVIQVVYPSGYFAIQQYLTTKRLNRIFRESDKTADGFIKAIKDNIAI